MKTETQLPNLTNENIAGIAHIISQNWPKVYFGAVPYLNAMYSLSSINDNYGQDSARSILLYFLANANTWRGPVAKHVKAHLKQMLKK